MRCFAYQAELLCVECAALQCALLDQGGQFDHGDSDVYPQGPYEASEADVPVHCGHCRRFLENPLTEDGRLYVATVALGSRASPVVEEWRRYYAPHVRLEELDLWAARRVS